MEYIRNKKVFASFGGKCSYMDRRVPLYVKLIKIRNNVFVGSNATILYNVRIGNNVLTGAGSLVTKDILRIVLWRDRQSLLSSLISF